MTTSSVEDELEELTEDIARRWAPERLGRLVEARSGGGEALPWHLRQRFERDLDVNLAHVRVFRGEFAQHVTKDRNADAITVGKTGMVLLGQQAAASTGSLFGERVLAHEVAHVAQGQRGLFDRSDLASPSDKRALEVSAHRYEEVFVGNDIPVQQTDVREQVRQRAREMVEQWLATERDRGGLGDM